MLAMLQLTQRPLTGSSIDAGLFVDRQHELTVLERSYQLSFNTLLLGERGIGVTSLIRQLHRRLDDQGVRTVYVDGATATTVDEFIEAIRQGPSGPRRPVNTSAADPAIQRLTAAEVRPGETSWRLGQLGNEIEGRPLITIDNAHDPDLIHTVFGRFRDDLWELPFTWIVCGTPNHHPDYVRPPADAFFDSTLTVSSLDDTHARELLDLRLATATETETDADSAHRVAVAAERLVRNSEGSPRQLLVGAREVALGTDTTAAEVDALLTAAETIGRPAAMLVAELRSLGAASASDAELLERLGWTRARATQVFKQLLDAGIVAATDERTPGTSGRPRKVYRLDTEQIAT